MKKNWICFFSQTGSEIVNVSNRLGRDPDLIITNRDNLKGINNILLEKYIDKIVFIPTKPSIEDYERITKKYSEYFNNCFITLHGFLRIIPDLFCRHFNIYNLHPGLITKYPELKGFNPQEKAFNLKLKTSGSVIHKVIAEVDSGEILDSVEISIENLSLDTIYNSLHNASTDLWVRFLGKLLDDNN